MCIRDRTITDKQRLLSNQIRNRRELGEKVISLNSKYANVFSILNSLFGENWVPQDSGILPNRADVYPPVAFRDGATRLPTTRTRNTDGRMLDLAFILTRAGEGLAWYHENFDIDPNYNRDGDAYRRLNDTLSELSSAWLHNVVLIINDFARHWIEPVAKHLLYIKGLLDEYESDNDIITGFVELSSRGTLEQTNAYRIFNSINSGAAIAGGGHNRFSQNIEAVGQRGYFGLLSLIHI